MTAPSQTSIQVTEGGREALRVFHKEMIVYARELPRLLDEEEEGRFVVIRGEEILGTWDTVRDAMQHGETICGGLTFFTHKVTRQDLVVMERLLTQEGYLPTPESQTHAGTASSASS